MNSNKNMMINMTMHIMYQDIGIMKIIQCLKKLYEFLNSENLQVNLLRKITYVDSVNIVLIMTNCLE